MVDVSGGRGVWVNGEPAASATIRDGDRIRAGRSDFVCHVEGVSEQRSPPVPHIGPASRLGQAALNDSGTPQAVVGRPVQTPRLPTACISSPGRLRPSGGVDPRTGSDAAALRDGRLSPSGCGGGQRRAELSVRLVGAAAKLIARVLHASDGDLISLIEAGWGRNAVVCMFWQAEKQAVVSHSCRSFLRTGEGQVVGRVGPISWTCCWKYYHRKFVQGLIQPLAGFFLECALDVNLWRLYSKADMSSTLRKMGLTPIEHEDA